MLVSECLDRCYGNWLYPSGINRPAFDLLQDAMSSSGDTVVLQGRLDDVPRDTILEIDSELVLTREVESPVITTQERGYLDTVADSHAAGTRVLVDPSFTRKSALDALKSIISGLYPRGIYARATVEETVDPSEVFDLPDGARKVLGILVRNRGSKETYYRLNPAKEDWVEFREFTPPKVQLFASANSTATVVYARDFSRPGSEADDLTTDCLISETLAENLPQAVAGQLLLTRELPRVQIEEIRRFLATQGVQVGAALNVGQALLQDFERRFVGAERQRQSEADPTTMTFVPVR